MVRTDTVVNVYEDVNGTVAGLVLVAANDNCGSMTSCLVFAGPHAGQPYAVQVLGAYESRGGLVRVPPRPRP